MKKQIQILNIFLYSFVLRNRYKIRKKKYKTAWNAGDGILDVITVNVL